MVNVLVVEDSKITREAIVHQLMQMPEYNIVLTIENAANADIACMHGNIDLILMDVCTADDESGLEAARRIKQHDPQIRIIIMTSMPEHSFLQKARKYGCDSFWYKEYGDVSLTEICRRTMRGESVFPADTPTLKIGEADSKDFSERERDVIRELVSGSRYCEIAQNLLITENTVKFHVKAILSKTGYRNTLQLVADVVEKRMVLPKY